jgi:hypothetical protein
VKAFSSVFIAITAGASLWHDEIVSFF